MFCNTMYLILGKALKISKKPCSDPNGRKGICTFKWDCINHNGTLMGTCMDGFIFGTCCQYDYDPFLHEEPLNEFSLFEEENKIIENNVHHLPVSTRYTTTTTSTPSRVVITSTRRPVNFHHPVVFIRPPIRPPTSPTTRPPTTRPPSTTRPPTTRTPITRPQTTRTPITRPQTTRLPTTSPSPTTSMTSSSTTGQLVTWSSIGPTRRPQPVPIRPMIISPFPFRPGISYAPASQGVWPVGIAFPVDPFQLNRPLQAFRPRPPVQTNLVTQSPSIINNQPNKTATINGTFTILNGADSAAAKRNYSSDEPALTTISVPIPQWSTAASTRSSSTRPPPTAGGSFSRPQTTIRPLLYAALNESSTTLEAASKTTKRPNLDYRKGMLI